MDGSIYQHCSTCYGGPNNALSVVKNVGNKLKKTKRSDALTDVLDIQSAIMEMQENNNG